MKIETERIVGKIRSIDRQNVEKFFVKLRFKKHNNLWSPSVDTARNPGELIKDIEKPGRLPPGQADYDCLRLLDSAHLSATEIVGLTGIDKSTISRALKRLSDEDFIELTGKKGGFGEIYYTTRCDNCWLEKDKEECKDELTADIERVLKSRGLKLANVNWDEFSNQALSQLSQNLDALEVEKTTKQQVKEITTLWDTLLKPKLDEIMCALEKRAVGMAGKQGWIDEENINELVKEKGKALPLLYFLGMKHTLGSEQIKRGLEMSFKEKSKSVANDKHGK